MAKLKAVYYVNQFYAGIGGEEKADMGLKVLDDIKGPAIAIGSFWGNEMEVVKVISCGDNFINNDEKYESILPEIDRIMEKINPDVFIAGPAFNAGRYGVACAKLCDYVKKTHNIPSVTAMYYENPAVQMYVKDNYIIESSETSAGMKEVLPILGKFSLKLAKGEKIGPARIEGYLPTGHRYNEYHEKTGAQRVVEILLKKLKGEKHKTEIPLRGFEKVSPADPIKDLKEAHVALITTGGLVPKGNPDKLKQAFSVTYGKYNIAGLDLIPKGDFISIHGGYDTTIVDEDPNRLVPLDELRILEREGKINKVYDEFFTTCGIGTNVESSKKIGRGIAGDLKTNKVNVALLTST
ncbi:glycine/betaine/sarcosine/D-proline family reductase selenoprotein B [Tepidimicrobium xylanilyticum]|uniref:Glycine reductase n=1 Tax=Tepidimicrobium xylanilyticum TaxID=1123352 RepID=A0A1H2RDC4_9FIRM|nr:glycine/betaine/sarcosine/D-proline family reductase selenoprotein B [Tepidimicrobium xylanilyticum]SDW17198.1 glycine reductase [Tepidimicrobium xylanilyticum]